MVSIEPLQKNPITSWEDQCEEHRTTETIGPSCAGRYSFINTQHTITQTDQHDRVGLHVGMCDSIFVVASDWRLS